MQPETNCKPVYCCLDPNRKKDYRNILYETMIYTFNTENNIFNYVKICISNSILALVTFELCTNIVDNEIFLHNYRLFKFSKSIKHLF